MVEVSKGVEIAIGCVSAAMFVGSIVAAPWLVRRLPADYFVRPRTGQSKVWRVVRNVLAAILLLLGIAMLVLPGQGILTVVLALSLFDHPLKTRAIAWLLRRPKVEAAVTRLREKAGQPPLIVPEPAT